jgi:hypothetical protein
VISGFCHEVDKNCTLLGYYTTSNGNFYQLLGQIIPIFKGQESKFLTHVDGNNRLSPKVGKKLQLLAAK